MHFEGKQPNLMTVNFSCYTVLHFKVCIKQNLNIYCPPPPPIFMHNGQSHEMFSNIRMQLFRLSGCTWPCPVIAIMKLWKCYLCFHSAPKIQSAVILCTKFTRIDLRTLIFQTFLGACPQTPLVDLCFARLYSCVLHTYVKSTQCQCICSQQLIPPKQFLLLIFYLAIDCLTNEKLLPTPCLPSGYCAYCIG